MGQPEAMGGYRPLSHIYEVPLDSALCAEKTATGRLLGIQACIFTEYVPTPENLEYQIWPRALAIAERGLRRTRSYEEFHQWAVGVADSMRQAGVNAFDLANEYGQRPESLQPVEHLAVGAKVTYNNPYNSFYKAGGDSALVDGVCGTWNNFSPYAIIIACRLQSVNTNFQKNVVLSYIFVGCNTAIGE